MSKKDKEKSPAFQMYPKDYLSDLNVQVMTLQEEGAYIRLMMTWWNERGYLPNDDDMLAKIVGKGCTQEIIGVVKKCFIPNPDDSTKLIQPRLQKEIIKQAEWSKKSSLGGKKGAETRWGSKDTDKNKGGDKMVLTKNNSPSSSPSPSSKFIIPSLQEVKDYFKSKSINESEGEGFYDFYVSKNWFVGKNKMKDWQAAVRNWIRNSKNNTNSPDQKQVYKGNFFNKKK